MRIKKFKSKIQAYRMAVKVYQCTKCGAAHHIHKREPKKHQQYVLPNKPNHCQACGHDNFIKSDSEKEWRRLNDLMQQQKFGEISELRIQVPFKLKTPNGSVFTTYRADFVYQQDKRRIIEDVKGSKNHLSAEFILKKNYLECEGYFVKLID